MTNRVDQTTVPGVLRSDLARIRALEAVPPGDSGCTPFFTWDRYGDSLFGIHYQSNDGCGTVTDPDDPEVEGLVWGCGTTNVAFATSLIVGSVRIILGDPGSIDSSGCTGADHVISYPYRFTPPFWQDGEIMGGTHGVLFGSGTYKQTSTGLTRGMWLHCDATGWNFRPEGVDYPNGNGTGDTFARPADLASGGAPAYPIAWQAGDVLFDGFFAYFVQIGD